MAISTPKPLVSITMGSRPLDSHATMLIASVLLTLFSAHVAVSQGFGNGYYRITNRSIGDSTSLDVINDGANNKLQLAASGPQTGQFWKITPVGNGYFRLTTKWLGESRSLDIVPDGANNKLRLADTGDFSGQFWKLTPAADGFYRLTTMWQGEARSLAVVTDGSVIKLQLENTVDKAEQLWKVAAAESFALTESSPAKAAKVVYLLGFKVLVNSEIAEKPDTQAALNLLSNKLEEIARIVKPKQLNALKQVPIWVEYRRMSDGAVWYHRSKDWLVSQGYPAELAKSVEIKNINNFIDWQRSDQPLMVLHELAHSYQDLHLSAMQDKITAAYKSALASGKYESVPYIRGGKQRACAMNDDYEYFAELTEAYFGKNDYYPFNRQDLKEFDPSGYQIMQDAWE